MILFRPFGSADYKLSGTLTVTKYQYWKTNPGTFCRKAGRVFLLSFFANKV